MTEHTDSKARPPAKGGRPKPFTDERDVAQRVLAGLSIVGTALRAQAWENAVDQGLTPTQGRILALLLRSDEGGVGLAHLAERLGVSAPTASDSLAALERKELVEKRANPDDRRSIAVTLTPSGVRAAEQVDTWPAQIASVIQELAGEDQAVMLKTLVTVVHRLQATGQIAPPRTCVTCEFFRPNVDPGADRPHYCAFVEAHFGDHNLRLDCRDHRAASPDLASSTWAAFRRSAG